MPSYAQEVKNELAHRFDERDCLIAEFVALIRVGAKKIDGRLEFSTSNAAVARRVIKLAKKFFPLIKPEVAAIRRTKLRKNMNYVVRFIAAGELQSFFDALDLDEFLKRTRFKIAYLRGAFLAKGTVNRPEGQYLLEIVTTEAEAHFIRKQLDKLDFNGGLYRRKKEFLVWLREADAICDFLGMVGADNAVERFEIARNIKEIRLQVNRVVNMETASLNRAVDIAQGQLADIKILLAAGVAVNKRLQQAIDLRLANPTATVTELAEKIPMTQAGLQYRFKLIHQLAEKLGTK